MSPVSPENGRCLPSQACYLEHQAGASGMGLSSSDQAVVVEMTKVPLAWNLSGQSPRSGHSWRERATRIPSQFDWPPRCMLWMVETKEIIPTDIKPSFWDTEQMKGKLLTTLCEPLVCWSRTDSWERHAVPLGTLCCLTAYLIAQKLP